MTGVTIDHMVSLVTLITVVMVSLVAYRQIIATAIEYQRNHETVMKAAELADTLFLSPGYPTDWGLGNSTPSAFGLEDPTVGGYSLSPFSLQRLSSPLDQVYYYKTGLWYSNNSLGGSSTLLVPIRDAINYTTAANLLGVNGTYGFKLTIMPTINVSITETSLNPLRLNVEVRGPSIALKDAILNYFLYHAVLQVGEIPSIDVISGTSQANSTGSALLEFPSINGSENAYSIIVYARLSGLSGVGYLSRDTAGNNKIVPFVEDFENRTVLLAHTWDVHEFPPPVAALHFNATYVSLTEDFGLRQFPLANSSGVVNSGVVNYGEGHPYARVQIPTPDPGILIVAYRWGNNYGISMMPWGVGILGFSVTFGGNPSGASWAATELRQVTISKLSYQAKVVVWSISGRQVLEV
jgi:hypothetical protein